MSRRGYVQTAEDVARREAFRRRLRAAITGSRRHMRGSEVRIGDIARRTGVPVDAVKNCFRGDRLPCLDYLLRVVKDAAPHHFVWVISGPIPARWQRQEYFNQER